MATVDRIALAPEITALAPRWSALCRWPLNGSTQRQSRGGPSGRLACFRQASARRQPDSSQQGSPHEPGDACCVRNPPGLFAPALAQAGLAPDRVIYVEAGDEKAVLAIFEEGLRHRRLGAVVAEVAHLSMAASRRLQLAPGGSGTIR